MQEGNKTLGLHKNVQFGWETFILSPVANRTVDFKELVSDLFHAGSAFGRQRIYQEKNEAIRIAQKHNNSLETFPYAIQKYLAKHQSNFTLQIPS